MKLEKLIKIHFGFSGAYFAYVDAKEVKNMTSKK